MPYILRRSISPQHVSVHTGRCLTTGLDFAIPRGSNAVGPISSFGHSGNIWFYGAGWRR